MRNNGTAKIIISLLLVFTLLGSSFNGVSFVVFAANSTDADVFSYRALDETYCTITKYNGNATEVEIPSKIEGYIVQQISDRAFELNRIIKKVVLPDSIISIGSEAFDSCSGLVEIELPDSITSIGSQAFKYCTSLSKVELPKNLTAIEPVTFYNCTSLTKVKVPNSVTSIGTIAFGNCTGLVDIELPENVTLSDRWEDTATFRNCLKLPQIILPSGVKSIPKYTFQDCSALKKVYLPKSITSIDMQAFYNCHALSDVYYEGTEEQWKKVSIGDDNDYLKNAAFHFQYNYPNESDETVQVSKTDKYTQQHVNFVNSATFNTASNDFRYATTLWTNYHGSTSQAIGEFVYDIQEGFFETISFQGMSSLENPYDAIILDLLSSKSVKASLSDAVDSSAISVIDSVIGDLITTFQADSDWATDIDIAGNFKDLLDLEATDYSSNKLYKSLDKLFDGKSTDQINSIFKKYDCYSNILANVSDAAKGVDYFLEILKYTASIEAYYSASEEFKAILKEVADVMPSVNSDYGQKFNETYNNYSSCIDYNSVMQNVLNHVAEEGFWLLTDLMSDVLQDSALTFCKTALKMSESAAGTLVASLWAAETGFNLGNMITENDTLINCRRLLRANYMLDEAVHHVMCSHASALKNNPSYSEALYFDAAFNLFKNLQINSLELHQKYMKTNGSSFINFLAGKQAFFKREAEAQAVIINTWKNITCHDENLVDSITYSKTNTVVVACPTNVYVYRKSDGELVASVVNNEVYNTDYALTVITESNEKAICLPNLNDYEIKIEATDDGSMEVDYTVSSLERPHYERAVLFNNVELRNQSTFDFQVDSNSDSISLIDENQDIVLPDLDTSDLIFKSASLTLQDDLVINYKVEETLFTENDYTNPYVIFSLNGVDTKVTEYTTENGKYIFDFENIIPHQMNDTIYATLYATYNGVEYASEVREYSVATYCYNMLNKYNTNEYAELQTLLIDLLNYGAASQVYMDYKTDNLVNANLTEEQKAWGTSTERPLETVQNLEYATIENPTVQWKGGGLNLQISVGMRFKITADNIENLTVKVTNDIGEETIITSDTFEVTDGGYYVFFEGLNAGQMSDVVYLTVYDGESAVSNTIRYSIESYAYAKQNSSDTNLAELVKSMMKYGDSAKAYVN